MYGEEYPWQYHLAANVIQHAYRHHKKYARFAQGYYHYKTARKMLGNLRGSAKRARGNDWTPSRPYSGPTLARVRALERKVNQQKPERIREKYVDLATSQPANTFTQRNVNIINSLVLGSDFRDDVIGDKFRIKYLEWKVKHNANSASLTPYRFQMRLILYIPKNQSDTISLSRVEDFVDPNQHTVLADRFITSTADMNELYVEIKRDLKDRIVKLRGTTVETNNLKWYCGFDNNMATEFFLDHVWRLTFSNK